ncbi:Unknown protein sequence [Pseudomonas savastanoi pv. phaseolicola]|nr:Unknown protein sequence [Pseudomonas savastanoi pv. phaseolicola]KPB49287.1 Unknown protein sequence [Pseudomonas savastanoi pv. phaseolicola]KPB56243.1 Unknown protein sequence [Pseudomonas savastanoi pv. phaseolicola]KPB65106.1 Unknown protein sequence [Pseudomonas amygdali pv. mellea]
MSGEPLPEISQMQRNGTPHFIADVANHALEFKWSQKSRP